MVMRKMLLLLLLVSSAVGYSQVDSIKPFEIHPVFDGYSKEYIDSISVEPGYEDVFDMLEGYELYNDFYSEACSWYCAAIFDDPEATSVLAPQGRNTYEAANIHDFNHETVWAEGVEGDGIGESIVYRFPGRHARITKVKILNGYVKNQALWEANGRVKSLKVYYNGELYAVLELEDSRTLQCFDVGILGTHVKGAPDWDLRFEIAEVYPGTKYSDTVISELYFDGIDDH